MLALRSTSRFDDTPIILVLLGRLFSFLSFIFFFFNDPATTEIYTLSLHDALPISDAGELMFDHVLRQFEGEFLVQRVEERKSTRLNSSHSQISYAVFCLPKKNVPVSLFDCGHDTPSRSSSTSTGIPS